MAEMIAIVICCQLCYGFIECPSFTYCQLVDFWLEITQHLFLGNAANGSIFRVETDVTQIIEHREERNLCKLGYACDEDKLLVFVVGFQYGKHLSIDAGACFVLRSLP